MPLNEPGSKAVDIASIKQSGFILKPHFGIRNVFANAQDQQNEMSLRRR